MDSNLILWVAWIQAAYFFGTGVWPLVSLRTFMAVTGPKNDKWLVRTVGVLVAVVGCVIGLAAFRRSISPEIITLAIGCAAALCAVDVIYVTRRVIPPIYLLDAVGEVVLIAGWIIGLMAAA